MCSAPINVVDHRNVPRHMTEPQQSLQLRMKPQETAPTAEQATGELNIKS